MEVSRICWSGLFFAKWLIYKSKTFSEGQTISEKMAYSLKLAVSHFSQDTFGISKIFTQQIVPYNIFWNEENDPDTPSDLTA